MRTTLLIDVNETLDNPGDYESREKNNKLFGDRGFTGPREGIEDFSDFLIQYREKLLPIFWTSVSVSGQKFIRDQWLKADLIGFDKKEFHLLRDGALISNTEITGLGAGGIKTGYFPILLEYIKGKSEEIIWFEDRLSEEHQTYVDAHQNIHHVGIDQNQTLTERIPEIIKLIK